MESCFVVSVLPPPVVSAPIVPPAGVVVCSVVLEVVSDFLEQPERPNAELRARPATSASAKYLRIS